MIVDSHCHAWPRWPYTVDVPDPATRGSIQTLLFEMDAIGVDHAVLVAAGIGTGDPRTDNTDNNRYVSEAVRRHPDRFSILLDVDSLWSARHHTPGASDRLRAALAIAGEAVGITHYLRDDVDDWFATEDATDFFSTVSQEQLLVSLHARPAWFAAVADLAGRFPQVPFLLHHQGHVDADAAWQMRALMSLVDHGNVYVKVSGFHYLTTDGWNFPYPDRRVFKTLVRHFGPNRLVWGSDFPVSRPHLTYRQSLEAIRAHSGLQPAALGAICGGTMAGLLERARRT